MMVEALRLAPFAAAALSPSCVTTFVGWKSCPRRTYFSSSMTRSDRGVMPPLPPQMIVATTGSSDTSIVESVAGTSLTSSWKLPWEARRETRELLTGVGYDTLAMGRFFEIRPERAFLRVAQIASEVAGVLLALAADQVVYAGVNGDVPDARTTDGSGNSAAGGAPDYIRRAITRLGPNFVKIGQALASRPDLVGEAVAGELLALQDAMPLFSNEIARDFILEELGAYPEDIFEAIGETPVAAASLGQVYKGRVDGIAVAVKVQRPGLLEAVALDFYVARGVAAAITRVSQIPGLFGGRLAIRSDLVAAVDEYGSRLFEELDYRNEARNMVRFRELYGAMPGVVVPDVLLDYSGTRVLTSEWIDGQKLVDNQAQVSPADFPILRVGIECTLTQLLDKGFLHADPHGGNLLKTADKQLAYLDFGLVSVIPPGVMDALICATVYVMNRDYVALAKGFPALALMSEEDLTGNFEPFAAALEGALDPIVADFRRQMGLDGGFGGEAPSGSERVAFAQLIDRVFLLARSFNFTVPPYFISNVRALGELEGLAMTADPGFNLISVVYPYVCRRLLSDPSPSLRVALEDLLVTKDGSIRWEVLEALMKDSNMLDQRVGAEGKTSRPPLDLSLEFLLSKDGAFVRNAAVSDVRRAALSFVNQKRRARRRSSTSSPLKETPPPGTKTGNDLVLRQLSSENSAAVRAAGRDERESKEVSRTAGEATAARQVSRRKFRRTVLQGARRRPLLAFRICATVAATACRRAGSAVAGSTRRLLPRLRRRPLGDGRANVDA